jgi:16S rRNA (guanine527-N7)-methyltransferase
VKEREESMEYDVSVLKGSFERIGIQLTDWQIEQFLIYYEFLVEKNKVMNLTGITEYQEVVLKHFVDSVALVKAVDVSKFQSLIDVGTGAGFPGVPLKIVFPHLEVVLLDSLNKRINFLNELIDKLRLENITAVHGRAEDGARKTEYREHFDLCVSRAVANLSSLSEYCIPFIKKDGLFISYKSTTVDDEITGAKKALFLLGGKFIEKQTFELPGSDIGRSLIVIKKEKTTPLKYPRKAGLPSKEPL